MTADGNGEHTLRPHQEVLPPISRSVSSAPEVSNLPQGFLGMAIFARARYASEQKQIEAYNRLVDAKNALIRSLNVQQSLAVEYAIAAERIRNLDDIREAARIETRNQLAGVRASGELAALRVDVEKERLQLERDQYRQRREALNTTPASSQPRTKATMADSFKQVGGDIEEIEQAYAKLRAEVIGRAGNEANLSEEDRRRLQQFEFLRDNLLNDVMGALL